MKIYDTISDLAVENDCCYVFFLLKVKQGAKR